MTNIFKGVATDTGLADHIADATDAHDASAISVADAGANFTATDVEAALAEEADARQAHEADTTDAHDASAISYAGGTGMSATDVEAAVDELATEKANASDLTAHTGDTTDAHDASAISFAPAGTIAATDVQAAIVEVASEASGGSFSGDAGDIPFTPAGTIAATDVQAAIEEVASEGGGGTTLPVVDTTAIVKDATDNTKLVRIEAGSIATGTTRVITMPNADVNLGDPAAHLADTTDAHDASAISFSPTGTIASTDVQAAIAEVASEASGGSGYRTLVTLGSDVNNATTTLADVTGLSFSVTSGTYYRFYAIILFDTTAVSNGGKFAMNGPAGIQAYTTRVASSQSTFVIQNARTWDTVATATNSPYTTENLAIIEGMALPSSSGTIVVRFASEAGSPSSVTAKIGSTLEYW